MAYSKTTWINDQAPALNATNLNKIEQGIYDAQDTADTNAASIAAIQAGMPEIDHGRGSISNIAGNGYGDLTVTFTTAFSSTPDVVATVFSSATTGYHRVEVFGASTTGCTIRVFNDSSSAKSPGVRWIAIN